MTRYDLTPKDSRKSFYGKYHVIEFEDGTQRLISYETPIIDRLPSGELVKIWDEVQRQADTLPRFAE